MVRRGAMQGTRKPGRRRHRSALYPDGEIDFGPLAGWVGFNLRMAQEAAFQAFSRLSHEIGEHPGRFATLTLIARNPGISPTVLGAASGRDKSSMTPVLDDLVRRGLVQRKRTDGDRRVWRLSLTPAGERMLAKMTACARRHERNLDRAIGTRDRARFVKVLRRLATAIE
ncbi:MAG: MarR family winged helix-turn-helix transcriptional regulator [Pseudolabrys sp.]